MEIKILLYTILYIASYLILIRGIDSISEKTNKLLKKRVMYLFVFLFGSNVIIDIGMKLKDKLSLFYSVIIILFFEIFFGLVVYISYKRGR